MSDIIQHLLKGITTSSEEETRAHAERFASSIPPDHVLALSGDLGTGKSTFVRGLATAWSITQPITSPTYNLYHLYKGTRQLIHFDAYRLDHPAQADALMLEEFMSSPWCLAIEWPEKIQDWLPDTASALSFSITQDGKHHIKLRSWESL